MLFTLEEEKIKLSKAPNPKRHGHLCPIEVPRSSRYCSDYDCFPLRLAFSFSQACADDGSRSNGARNRSDKSDEESDNLLRYVITGTISFLLHAGITHQLKSNTIGRGEDGELDLAL